MKKQLILISRIYSYESEEFLKYADENSDEMKRGEMFCETENYKLLILKGSLLYKEQIEFDEDNKEESRAEISKYRREESERILKIALSKDFDKNAETIIAYHDNSENLKLDELNFAINKLGIKVVGIQKYSSTDEILYQEIVNPLGESILNNQQEDLPKLIEKLWHFFCLDFELEEKLKLIEKIKTGEAKKGDKLDEKIEVFQTDFDDFIKNHPDYFSVVENQDALDKYRLAYDKFYDRLGLEN